MACCRRNHCAVPKCCRCAWARYCIIASYVVVVFENIRFVAIWKIAIWFGTQRYNKNLINMLVCAVSLQFSEYIFYQSRSWKSDGILGLVERNENGQLNLSFHYLEEKFKKYKIGCLARPSLLCLKVGFTWHVEACGKQCRQNSVLVKNGAADVLAGHLRKISHETWNSAHFKENALVAPPLF